MKPKKIIFQCPYKNECNKQHEFLFYENEITYYMDSMKCKHPFLTFRGEPLCNIVIDEDDFDYDGAMSLVKIHWRVKFRRIRNMFKRMK